MIYNNVVLTVNNESDVKEIKCFTTRPDTLFGFSFLAVSVDHPIAKFYEKDKSFLSFKKVVGGPDPIKGKL